MHREKTYPEVMCHYSLGHPAVSIRTKPVLVTSSDELQMTIPGQCHHTQVVKMNQIIQHLVD
jgi:hypothetical protein